MPSIAPMSVILKPLLHQEEKPKLQRHEGPLSIRSLIFPRLVQLDFTGPFEVFSRLPQAKVHMVAETVEPIADMDGQILNRPFRRSWTFPRRYSQAITGRL